MAWCFPDRVGLNLDHYSLDSLYHFHRDLLSATRHVERAIERKMKQEKEEKTPSTFSQFKFTKQQQIDIVVMICKHSLVHHEAPHLLAFHDRPSHHPEFAKYWNSVYHVRTLANETDYIMRPEWRQLPNGYTLYLNCYFYDLYLTERQVRYMVHKLENCNIHTQILQRITRTCMCSLVCALMVRWMYRKLPKELIKLIGEFSFENDSRVYHISKKRRI